MDLRHVRSPRTDRTPVPIWLAATAQLRDRLAWLPYALADVCARTLPRPLLETVARAAARLAFALRVPARARLEANLARVLGAAGHPDAPGAARPPGRASAAVRRTAREAFEEFALTFLDFLTLSRLARPALERGIVVSGAEHLAHARGTGRGVIVLSVHAGNWEWGAAWLASRGTPVRVVARPHASAKVERFFARRRAAWGVSRLCGRPLWRDASDALRRSEWVALMGDRPSHGARGSLCAWAAALARRTGAIVLPAAMTRLPDGRYLASFEPPLDAAACAAVGFRDVMLRQVRRAPGQWFAFEPLAETIAGSA